MYEIRCFSPSAYADRVYFLEAIAIWLFLSHVLSALLWVSSNRNNIL